MTADEVAKDIVDAALFLAFRSSGSKRGENLNRAAALLGALTGGFALKGQPTTTTIHHFLRLKN
jgi:hypothetical protein